MLTGISSLDIVVIIHVLLEGIDRVEEEASKSRKAANNAFAVVAINNNPLGQAGYIKRLHGFEKIASRELWLRPGEMRRWDAEDDAVFRQVDACRAESRR